MIKSLTHHNKYQNSSYAFFRSLARSYLNHKRVLVTAFILFYKKTSNRVILFHINQMLLSNLPYRLFIFAILYQLFLRTTVTICEMWNPLETVVGLLISEPLENNPLSEKDTGTIHYPRFVTATAELLISKPLEDESSGSDSDSSGEGPLDDVEVTKAMETYTTVLLNETQFYESLRQKYHPVLPDYFSTIIEPTSHYSSDSDSSYSPAVSSSTTLTYLSHPDDILDTYFKEILCNAPTLEDIVSKSFDFVDNLIPDNLWGISDSALEDPNSAINIYLKKFVADASITREEREVSLKSFQAICGINNALIIKKLPYDQNIKALVPLYQQTVAELYKG